MIPDPYDSAGRDIQRENPALLGWLLSLRAEQYDFVVWLDTRAIPWPGSSPGRTRDVLAHVRDPASLEPWAILVEFQLQPDPDMLSRVMIYLADARMKLRPTPHAGDRFNVGAAVVNLTGRGNTSLDMNWPGAGLRTLLQVREINMAERDAWATLERIDAGEVPLAALVFIPLMKRGDEDVIIQRWLGLAGRESNRFKRADLGLALTFAEAVDRQQVWRKALEGWNVQESKILNEWMQPMVARAVEKAVEEAVEKAVEEAVEKAVEEAVEKAERKKELKSKAEFVVELLRDRLGTPPADLITAIESASDPSQLRRLLHLAGRSATFEQFRQDAGF